MSEKIQLSQTRKEIDKMLKAELKVLLEATIAAEVSDSLTVKQMTEQLFSVADPAAEVNPNKKADLKANQFEYNDGVYEVVMGKVNIPGVGVLTAAEIALEESAQKYLVDNGCVGSVLKQIFN